MFAVSDDFLRGLRSPHKAITRVDVKRGGVTIARDVPIAGGSVLVDASSAVRRTCTVTLHDPALNPGSDAGAVLTPFGTVLHVYRGMEYPGGVTEWCPLGVFRIDAVDVAASGAIVVQGSDYSATVAEARFLAPEKSTNVRTRDEIQRLLYAVDPTFTLTDFSPQAETADIEFIGPDRIPMRRNENGILEPATQYDRTPYVPASVWELDRAAAIDELATSVGADVYFDQYGHAVIVRAPAITDPVAWTVDAGEAGVLVDYSRRTSRERTYNAVVATGERTDDVPPVRAVISDDDPLSPTQYGGPFGKVPRFYSSPLLNSVSAAGAAARKILDRTRALNRQTQLTCVPNPALDAGDVISIVFADRTSERHIVDGLDVPLDTEAAMTVTTRSTQPEFE